MSEETLTRWQDPTIDDLIKENLELKRKLGEADDAVEYWQIECDKRNKVLDKIKEYVKEWRESDGSEGYGTFELLELLEEIDG